LEVKKGRRELYDNRVVVIFGFDHISRNLASKAKHVGFKVSIFDPFIGGEDAKEKE